MIRMTDNEIIKSLECCADHNNADACDDCPCLKGECISTTPYVLDLINRQKAEIEALIAGQETLQKNLAKSLKVEAYNEIAESVKIKTLAMVHSPVILTTADYIKCIDDIVKEMVGENND